MRTWNFPARAQRHLSKPLSRGRRPAFESLEDRRVLAVDFDWAFTLGAAGSDSVRDVAVDAVGNISIVGRFAGTVDFDPSPGVYNLTSTPADSRNSYVAKYDANGNLLAAQRFGDGAANVVYRSIAFDGVGNTVIVGTFTGTAEFGSTTLTSQGLDDVFLAKFDAGGTVLWARRYGESQTDFSDEVAIDVAGNVLIGIDFGNGSKDSMIVKLDPSGNELWTWRVGTSTSTGRKNTANSADVNSITVDDAGNVYATGGVSGTVDFDPGPAVATLSSPATGAFVVKLTSSGNLSWARGVAASNIGYVYSRGIAVGPDGTVYSAGSFYDRADFDPGPLKTQKYILNSGGSNAGSGFVTALDANGNFVWAKSTRSVAGGHVIPLDFVLDTADGIYVTGEFSGAVDFDPGVGETTLNASNSYITFVWKLAANGGFEWAGALGTQGDHYAYGIDVDAAGNIYAAGQWRGIGDFDPGAGTYNLTSAGYDLGSTAYDGYLVKLTQTSTLAASASTSLSTSSLPATEPAVKKRRATLDSAFASLSLDRSQNWTNSLDEELLLAVTAR